MFGDFLAQKRKEKEISLRALAIKLGISSTYLSDIENNRRNPLGYEKLQIIIDELGLTKEEQDEMYNLAGESKDTIPSDVEKYIKENTEVIALLRKIQQNPDYKDYIEKKGDNDAKK